MRATWWRRGVVASLLIVGGIAVWIARTDVAHAQTAATGPRPAAPASSGPPAMTADLRIRRRQITGNGADLGPAGPGVVVHLERRQAAGAWKTSLALSDFDRPEVHAARGLMRLEHPFLVARMEIDDEGGAEPRMYDGTGRQVVIAGERERRLLGLAPSLRARAWDSDVLGNRINTGAAPRGPRGVAVGLTAEAGRKNERRQQFEQRYGRAAGRVRGLDRFVSDAGGSTEEVLVAPDSALPAEVNIVDSGTLVSRVQLTYEPNAALGFVRRVVRSEQVVDRRTGVRLVTEVELANLVVNAGGAR